MNASPKTSRFPLLGAKGNFLSVFQGFALAGCAILNLGAVENPYDLPIWQTRVREGTVRPFSFQIGGRPACLTMLGVQDSIEDGWHKTVVEYKEAQQPLKVTLTCLFAPKVDMVRLFVTLTAEENLSANVQKVQILNLFPLAHRRSSTRSWHNCGI